MLLAQGTYRFDGDRERHLLVVTERRALLVDYPDLMRGRATTGGLPPLADLTRRIEDGYELVELQHNGRHGSLKTKSKEAAVYEALTGLKSRLQDAVPVEGTTPR